LLQIPGARTLIGRPALGHHLIELEVDIALEVRDLRERVGPGRDEPRRRGIGRASGRRLDPGAREAREGDAYGEGDNGPTGRRRLVRGPRSRQVGHPHPSRSRFRTSSSRCSFHAASFSRSRATTSPGARATNCELPSFFSWDATSPASRSASAPRRPHSRPTSIASPKGTKTDVPSGSTAFPPTRSELSPTIRSDSLASRTIVPRSRWSVAEASPPSTLAYARTLWPGWTPYSARIPRMAPTTCWTRPKSARAFGSPARASGRGHGATEIEAPAGRPGN